MTFCSRGCSVVSFSPEKQIKGMGGNIGKRTNHLNPTEIDSEGQPFLAVDKDGNTTDLTFGHYASSVLFALNEVGIPSVELGIYNMGVKTSDAFSAKGDSGSLVLRIAPRPGTYCSRSRSSSTPTSTAPAGEIENNIFGFSLSISTRALSPSGAHLAIQTPRVN